MHLYVYKLKTVLFFQFDIGQRCQIEPGQAVLVHLMQAHTDHGSGWPVLIA